MEETKKIKILFVDDEVTILNGLKRILHPMQEKWEMTFITEAKEAVQLIKESHFDIVISDMKMPKMDGLELLHFIKQEYPGIIRIILSGHSEKEIVLKSVDVAHQYLSKPCDVNILKKIIAQTCSLRSSLQKDSIRVMVSSMSSVPTLPPLYKKIVAELNSPDASIYRIGNIIETDVGMTAKVLQLVNSAFFGLRRTIYKPSEAVALLGLDTIKSLVLSIGIFSQYPENRISGLSIKNIIKHSLACATLAKTIARQEKLEKFEIANSFTAGMLHDTGKLILAMNFKEKYSEIKDKSEQENIPLWKAEKDTIGVTHSEIGAYLLGLWGIPDPIVEAVAYHHIPEKSYNLKLCSAIIVFSSNIIINNKINANLGNIKRIGLNEKIYKWKDFFNKEKYILHLKE